MIFNHVNPLLQPDWIENQEVLLKWLDAKNKLKEIHLQHAMKYLNNNTNKETIKQKIWWQNKIEILVLTQGMPKIKANLILWMSV